MRAGDAVRKAMTQEPDKPEYQRAYDHVLRAQSNDGYWHGVFGGLYLSHLRQSVYSKLQRLKCWFKTGVARNRKRSRWQNRAAKHESEVALRAGRRRALVVVE